MCAAFAQQDPEAEVDAVSAHFKKESEKVRHHMITEMLLEHSILEEVGRNDRTSAVLKLGILGVWCSPLGQGATLATMMCHPAVRTWDSAKLGPGILQGAKETLFKYAAWLGTIMQQLWSMVHPTTAPVLRVLSSPASS